MNSSSVAQRDRPSGALPCPRPRRYIDHNVVIGRSFWKLATNLLSAARFFLAALWLAVYASGNRRPALLGPIALAGAAFRTSPTGAGAPDPLPDEFGSWLDAIADIVIVLRALSCEAHAGSIPAYSPF